MAQHQRLTDALQDYWQQKRGKRSFPAIEDIIIDELEQKDQQDSFLIQLIPTIHKFNPKFLFLGPNLSKDYCESKSGKMVRNVVVDFLETTNSLYEEVVLSKQPYYRDEVFVGKDDHTIKYRQVLLPLGPKDNEPINGIFGGMRYMDD